MCVGTNCDGSPLPIVYHLTDYTGAPAVVMTYPSTAYPITVNGQQIKIGKLHNCPSCDCISAQP